MSRKLAARVTLGAMLSTLPVLAVSACSIDADSGRGQPAAGSAGTTGSAGSSVQPSSGSSSGGSAHSGTSGGGSDAKAGSASGSGNGGSASGGGNGADPCAAPGLTWKSARKTWYTSYPDPGSEE